jgi:nucleotide-binding universal stress UspA family protein
VYNKILIPTDGSKSAYNAAKHAVWAANSCSADIVVLNVVEYSKLPEINVVDVEIKLKEMLMEEGNEALKEISELFNESSKDINVSYMIKEGSPANKILETIDNNDIDMVVMGTAGKHGLDRILMGSVAEKVVRNANCAVTVIH